MSVAFSLGTGQQQLPWSNGSPTVHAGQLARNRWACMHAAPLHMQLTPSPPPDPSPSPPPRSAATPCAPRTRPSGRRHARTRCRPPRTGTTRATSCKRRSCKSTATRGGGCFWRCPTSGSTAVSCTMHNDGRESSLPPAKQPLLKPPTHCSSSVDDPPTRTHQPTDRRPPLPPVYVARNTYIRVGAVELHRASGSSTVFLACYYRYYRFFPNGQVRGRESRARGRQGDPSASFAFALSILPSALTQPERH
jgi:hypothetical protein